MTVTRRPRRARRAACPAAEASDAARPTSRATRTETHSCPVAIGSTAHDRAGAERRARPAVDRPAVAGAGWRSTSSSSTGAPTWSSDSGASPGSSAAPNTTSSGPSGTLVGEHRPAPASCRPARGRPRADRPASAAVGRRDRRDAGVDGHPLDAQVGALDRLAGLEVGGRDEDLGAVVAGREQQHAAERAEHDEQHAGDEPRRVAVAGLGDPARLEPGRGGRPRRGRPPAAGPSAGDGRASSSVTVIGSASFRRPSTQTAADRQGGQRAGDERRTERDRAGTRGQAPGGAGAEAEHEGEQGQLRRRAGRARRRARRRP